MVNLRKPAAGYWPVYAVCLGVWRSCALWLVYHCVFPLQTTFGTAPNPEEHWSPVAHDALAFASLWLMGFVWGTHATKRWRLGRHRRTGGTLFAVMAVLIVSGYLLYSLSDDSWRVPAATLHWVVGLGMPLAPLAHWLIRLPDRRGSRRGSFPHGEPRSVMCTAHRHAQPSYR